MENKCVAERWISRNFLSERRSPVGIFRDDRLHSFEVLLLSRLEFIFQFLQIELNLVINRAIHAELVDEDDVAYCLAQLQSKNEKLLNVL